jgi:diadenosine tetraphosphate (Ap4A) HIT family hydrolase
MTSEDFQLDKRLAGDTTVVCDWPLSRVLLIDDKRYAWLVLVPRRAGAVEAFDLSAADRTQLWREATALAEQLKQATHCRKVNIGALGNIVSQLHVHVVARREGDAAWPGPVWGVGLAERYDSAALQAEAARWRTQLRPPAD